MAGALVASPVCYTFQRQVGSGGSGGETVEDYTCWVLWGRVPITEPDSKEMAGEATDFTVTTELTIIDVILSAFTGTITIHRQTVTVQKQRAVPLRESWGPESALAEPRAG
jgi:hypothetical protein